MTKKQLKFYLICFMTILSCLVFAFANLSNNSVYASTFGNASVALKLVGHNGYTPKDYFDSLSQAGVSSISNYYDSNGNLTDEYYAISTKISSWFGDYTKGSASFTPFQDYISLAETGDLYVYAKTGIVGGSGSKNTVTISLNHNGQTKSVYNTEYGSYSNGIYYPYYYQTGLVNVVADQDITFSFTNQEKSSWFSPASFKLFEPSIMFKTIVNDISFSTTNETFYHGDTFKLNASNSILDIASTSSLVSYYKNMHKIQYEIVSGGDKAKIIGNYIYFTGESSGQVKIRAKCLKDSESNEYIYSDVVTYNYISQKEVISVLQHFNSSATIYGEGQYYVGDNVTLIASMNSGYTFMYWLLNGQVVNTTRLYFTCLGATTIELYSVKDVSIESILVKDKYYDGTLNADIDDIVISGLKDNDNVYLNDLTVKYYSVNAGTKSLELLTTPVLLGDDAQFYNLSSVIPDITGTILPKPVSLTINSSEKIYGETDPAFTYSINGLIGNDKLNETLTRNTGEDVGTYEILATTNNSNYNVTLNGNILTILPKQLTANKSDIGKVYDKSVFYTYTPEINGIEFNDLIAINITLAFATQNVGTDISLTLNSYEITGNKKYNYYFDANTFPVNVGNISPKDVFVEINNATKIYGGNDPDYTYTMTGIIAGDNLNGQIERVANENVGKYYLIYVSGNSNYLVTNSSSYLTILPKDINVYANEISKEYGENDPTLTYSTNGLIGNDNLTGTLQRESGEAVGNYLINVGNLKNSNYNINFVSGIFTIQKRILEGTITVNSKHYDGTTIVNGYSYYFTNLVSTDKVKLTLDLTFSSANAGNNVPVNVNSLLLDNENYTIEIGSLTAEIIRRPVDITINSFEKIYGDNDEILTYNANNIVADENLVGNLDRDNGENVGEYEINLGTITDDNNPNYYIILNSVGTYTITQRTINYKIVSNEKFYSQDDPQCEFALINSSFGFDDGFNDIISGSPTRVSGEIPGVYLYSIGSLNTINSNYKANFVSGGELVIKKLNITVTANSEEKVYGDIDPILSYETSVEDENLTLSLERENGENVGTYRIACVSLFNDCYAINFVEGAFTITPRQVTLKIDDKVKDYGNTDPQFTCYIASGILANGDSILSVSTGNLIRENNENVGSYQISQGSFELSSNYQTTFESGIMTILPKDIQIQADNLTKQYNQTDPELTYQITNGSLAFDDEFSGVLVRESGQTLGTYQISQGSLKLSSNYNLTFESGTLTIIPADLIVTVENLQKQYGDDDPQINYTLSQCLPISETLNGNVSRQSGENVGVYNYVGALNNSNYNIQYSFGTFEITKRIIDIKAKSYIITYGNKTPTLEYTIYGTIMPSDVLSGQIYKVAGDEAGTYDINSTLSLGRNYQINYTKGIFTINPKDIQISCDDVTKIYGQTDFKISYEIADGQLVGDDKLNGIILRSEGENVGEYDLIPSFSNANYNVTILSGSFTILPKDITLYTKINDKIYDGSSNATLATAIILGLVDNDDVSLSYDANNCATFINNAVGKDIAVTLHDITLIGHDAENYNLILPQETGNITYDELSDQNVSVFANSSTELTYGTVLSVTECQINEEDLQTDKILVQTMQISLLADDEDLNLNSSVEVQIDLQNKNYQNVTLYLIDEFGTKTIVESSYKNGILTFKTDKLGKIEIIADDLSWLDTATIFSAVLLFGVVMLYIIFEIVKKKKNKAK